MSPPQKWKLALGGNYPSFVLRARDVNCWPVSSGIHFYVASRLSDFPSVSIPQVLCMAFQPPLGPPQRQCPSYALYSTKRHQCTIWRDGLSENCDVHVRTVGRRVLISASDLVDSHSFFFEREQGDCGIVVRALCVDVWFLAGISLVHACPDQELSTP
ncbi:hypothetical protein JAAARDRAFT_33523 [Jaapia argillacea MUCL 33604]|uniref:Uncharacterized protein n=1 Tax=Jaapia argillacea MUCL 33604 TaxID=933084 RepID=A0A067Q8X6_9AGAM|nr:hypothetical protein JAAARDRAFT_33523 [Jaapia argillacea MUCL 33604]